MSFDLSDPSARVSFLQQFTNSIQAIVSLTESLKSLKIEVQRHAELLSDLDIDLNIIKSGVGDLKDIVVGQGMSDSLFKSIVELKTNFHNLTKSVEEIQEEMQEENRTKKSSKLVWIITIVTVLSGLATAFISGVLPEILKKIFTQ
jgi:hypothetical protein